MNKNILVILTLLLVALPSWAYEETALDTAAGNQNSEVMDQGKNDAHWAISLSLGTNWFDADFHTKFATGLCSYPGGNAALGLEYHFTPAFGAILQYQYNHVFGGRMVLSDDKHYYGMDKTDDGTSRFCQARIHNVELLVSYDIASAWAPKTHQNLVSFYLLAGGGVGFYSGYGRQEDRGYGNVNINPQYYAYPDDRHRVMAASLVSAGMMLEFNCTKTFSLGVKAMYDYYISDMLDNIKRGDNNDGVVDLAINLRFKLNAKNKDHIVNQYNDTYNNKGLSQAAYPHVRDTVYVVSSPAPMIEAQNTTNTPAANPIEAQSTTDTPAANPIEAQNTTNTLVANPIENVAKDTTYSPAVEVVSSPVIPQVPVKIIHDTVVVESVVSRVVVEENTSTSYVAPQEYFYAYFANNKSDLTNQALVTIQQVANRLQKDENLCIVIEGHADMTGTSDKNVILSQNRADNIRNELIKVYNISSKRIKAVGTGELTNVISSYGPNRRADLRLMSQEDFQKDNTALKTKAQRLASTDANVAKKDDGAVQTQKTTVVSSQKQASASNVKASRKKLMAKVYVSEGQTLCRISLHYYGDIKYWPLLYKYNKVRIKNPNMLRLGTRVDVPYLTEEDQQTDWSNVAWEVLNGTNK